MRSEDNLTEQRPELFFGLVAAIGTDLALVSKMLEEALSDVNYKCEHIKLSALLEEEENTTADAHDRYLKRMTAGTNLRKKCKEGMLSC